MKIAIVSIRFDQRGGSERRTYQLAKGLLNAGHEVEVFAAEVSDMDLNARVGMVPMQAGPSFMKVLSFTRNVGRMLDSRPDFDVVHNQIRPFTDGIVTVGGGCHAEYLELSGRRLSFLNPLHGVILGLERRRYRQGGCRAVITNSGLSKRGILRHYPIPPDRVFVVHNGVDSGKFHPERVRAGRSALRSKYDIKDEPVMLFVGNGFRRKGLATAIRALPILKGSPGDMKNARLLVVGEDDAGPYKRLAAGLGVSDMVVFAGRTKSPESFYGAADIFVLPTKYDPFSNATLEAMACGLPVITTAQNGVSEIIWDGVSGFVVDDPDDHLRLAEIIASLSDGGKMTRAGAAARKAAELMTWENTTRRTLAVYETAYA